ncbi:hypothetical protein LCDVSa002R [Lymphocystis disease virus 3]|uniref:Uncharacterized protein n=1 Tax=Lymphocystis disease virus 3 TaxID=2560566 RepID=A0A1B2RVR1_9VIRU|nr:hypothetical protein BZK12_gp002 [Lymphocystis disease virus Sa]AOC55086.1 hypothetical protein LCDVSa002R [Lymphocystis disease virus 3]
MTHDFRIIPPHYRILSFDSSNVINRLTKLENDRRDVTVFVQKFPDVEKCCKNLNLKFDVILKEFNLIKNRVEELAQTAHEALDKSEVAEEKIKILVAEPNHLKDLDSRVTELVKQFVVVKTVTEQNREVCTVVQDQVSNLKTNVINPLVKIQVDKEATDLKDELDHIKSLIEDDLETFKKKIEDKLKNKPGGAETSNLTELKEYIDKRLSQPENLTPAVTKLLNDFKKEVNAKIASVPDLTKLKTRIDEIADVADSNLTKIENLKPVIDAIEDFKVIKTMITQNKEICKAVKTKADKLEDDLIVAEKDLKSSIKETETTLLTEIERVKVLIKPDSKELEKLKNRINEIADVAHEAGKCCDEIGDFKKNVEAIKVDVNKIKQDVSVQDKKLNDVKTKCEADVKKLRYVELQAVKTDVKRLEENGKIQDDEIEKLVDAKIECEAAVQKLGKEVVDNKNKIEAELKTLKTKLEDEANKIEDLETAKDVAIKNHTAALALIERTRSELNDAVNKHELLTVMVQGHSNRFGVLDQTLKTLEALIEARHKELRAAVDALSKSLTSKITDAVTKSEKDVNNLKGSIADQTKALTDLRSDQDNLKSDLYKKLKTDYDELRAAVDKASKLTIDAVKEALNWTDLVNRVEFLENEVNVNVKTRFVNLENSLNELQGVASDAHDLATLLQQTLKSVPDKIKAIEENTGDLKTLSQSIEGISGKNEKNITSIAGDVEAVKSTLTGVSDKITVNKNETDTLQSLISDLDGKTDDVLVRIQKLENKVF